MLYISSTGDLCLTGSLLENIQDINNPENNNYSLVYDSNGNQVQGFGKYYEYDDFNHLIKARQNNASGTLLEEYFYDHEGNRIKKIEYSINTTTYYIDENFIQIVNISGTYNETYYYAEDILVAKKDNKGVITYYHPDHLGSTNLVTNQSGGVVEVISYSPFGEVIGGGESRYLFTGKELDRGTNFEYYGARYYYPYIGIFITPDQNIQNVYNSQDLNRYMYVRGNPYKYVDKDGNSALPVIAGIGFVAGALYYMEYTPVNEQNSGWERVGKAYAMGALTATGAVAASELTFSGGALRIAGGGLTASSLLKGGAVAASLDVARQVIAEEKPFNRQSTIVSGIAGTARIPTGGGGQFTGIGMGKSGLYFGKNLFTSQNIDISINSVYNEILSNSISNIINNYQNNKQNQTTQQSVSGSGGSSYGGSSSGPYFNWNTEKWETPSGCNSYVSCFQQQNKNSGGIKK